MTKPRLDESVVRLCGCFCYQRISLFLVVVVVVVLVVDGYLEEEITAL